VEVWQHYGKESAGFFLYSKKIGTASLEVPTGGPLFGNVSLPVGAEILEAKVAFTNNSVGSCCDGSFFVKIQDFAQPFGISLDKSYRTWRRVEQWFNR